jgi:hypothetical protein
MARRKCQELGKKNFKVKVHTDMELKFFPKDIQDETKKLFIVTMNGSTAIIRKIDTRYLLPKHLAYYYLSMFSKYLIDT